MPNMYRFTRQEQSRIAASSASQGIERTIQDVEEALNTTFPRGRTPSKSREKMCDILREKYRKR